MTYVDINGVLKLCQDLALFQARLYQSNLPKTARRITPVLDELRIEAAAQVDEERNGGR